MLFMKGADKMAYTIKALAELVGISTRTLRYYDQINLLKPATTNDANYRLYERKQVQRLHEIMTYRSLSFTLEEIKQLLKKPPTERDNDLKQQLEKLEQQQNKLTLTIKAVQQQLAINQGVDKMTDQEQFEIFKQQKIAANEAQFGAEIRTKYSKEEIDQTNRQYANLTAAQFHDMQVTENNLISLLKQATTQHNVTTEQAQTIYQLHRHWLSYTWPTYSAEAHRGLVELYLADQRFANYYDQQAGIGATQILHDSIVQFTQN